MRPLTTLLLLLTIVCAHAQDRTIRFSVYPHATYSDLRTTMGGGIGLDIPIGERFGIFYNYSIGGRLDDGAFYLHAPATTVAGAFWLSTIEEGQWGRGFGAVLLLIPEGISYDLLSNDETRMTANFVFNGYEYENNSGDEDDSMVTFGTSVTYSRNITDRMFIAFEPGVRKAYTRPRWLTDLKIRIGWNLN